MVFYLGCGVLNDKLKSLFGDDFYAAHDDFYAAHVVLALKGAGFLREQAHLIGDAARSFQSVARGFKPMQDSDA